MTLVFSYLGYSLQKVNVRLCVCVRICLSSPFIYLSLGMLPFSDFSQILVLFTFVSPKNLAAVHEDASHQR